MLDSLDTVKSVARRNIGAALSHLTPDQSRWLKETAEQIERTGWAAEIYDSEWHLLWVSEELQHFLGSDDPDQIGYGKHILEAYRHPAWRNKVTPESFLSTLDAGLSFIAYDTPGGVEALRDKLDPELHPLLEQVEPKQAPPVWSVELELLTQPGQPPVKVHCFSMRIFDADQKLVGTARIYGPGLRASLLTMVARGDEQMFERMSRLVSPGRQPVAVMFADLESSTQLSRRLPSAAYFELISALTKEIDTVILRHEGVVGKHSGDGVSAFFIADEHGAISSAARASIVVAREIQDLAPRVAEEVLARVGVPEDDRPEIKLNIGLHWGATVYMGQIATGGRVEVAALGDEINDCARIEECASGGKILASKALVERLSSEDASFLELNTSSRTYELLSDLGGAGKAERDQINIPVTQL